MKKNGLILFVAVLCFSSCKDTASELASENTEQGITYSFYYNSWGGQAWATIVGEEGDVPPTVASPTKSGYKFAGWNTSPDGSGSGIPAVFGSSSLSFYAQWKAYSSGEAHPNNEALIGTKPVPDALYDIVFTDGSAMAYPENLGALTEEQIDAAVAMIFTTTYNPNDGTTKAGGDYQYKLAAGLVLGRELPWVLEKDAFQLDVIDDSYEGHKERTKDGYMAWAYDTFCFNLLWGGYEYSKGSEVLRPKQLSDYYGAKNYVDSVIFKTVDNNGGFDYAVGYGVSQNMKVAYRDGWYLPSSGELKVLLSDSGARIRFADLAGLKNKGKGGIADASVFWSSSSDTTQKPDTSTYVGDYYDSYKCKGHFGAKEADESIISYKAWVFDPSTCTPAYVQIPINKKPESDSQVWHQKSDGSWDNDPGYWYQYVWYSKAYAVDWKGERLFDDKLKKHDVISVRVF